MDPFNQILTHNPNFIFLFCHKYDSNHPIVSIISSVVVECVKLWPAMVIIFHSIAIRNLFIISALLICEMGPNGSMYYVGQHVWMPKGHADVIKWKHFPRYWPFVRGIHRSPLNSPHKGQWRGALMFSLICAWMNGWINNREGRWFETPSRPLWRHCNGNNNYTLIDVILFTEII